MKGCVLLSQLLKTQFYIALPDCTLVLSFCIFTLHLIAWMVIEFYDFIWAYINIEMIIYRDI